MWLGFTTALDEANAGETAVNRETATVVPRKTFLRVLAMLRRPVP
jgi:hypothetical protein